MKILTNPDAIVRRLAAHIKSFGHTPDHHLSYMLYHADPDDEIFYFDFGNGGGLFLCRRRERWYVLGEPLTGSDTQIKFSIKVIEYIFEENKNAKVTIEEWNKDLSKEFIQNLPPKFRAARPHFIYKWPICDLNAIDSELRGHTFKGFRYAMNRFSKNHEVRITDIREVSADVLKNLLHVWKERCRTVRGERVVTRDFEKFIENNFPSCDIRRAIFIDGVLRGMSAGWKISRSRNYYFYLDIHDYSDEYLGEFISLDHFLEAKRRGYQLLNFGGSDKNLLNFKMKFHPIEIYTTYNFSIFRK